MAMSEREYSNSLIEWTTETESWTSDDFWVAMRFPAEPRIKALKDDRADSFVMQWRTSTRLRPADYEKDAAKPEAHRPHSETASLFFLASAVAAIMWLLFSYRPDTGMIW